jgi:hypothetical protein
MVEQARISGGEPSFFPFPRRSAAGLNSLLPLRFLFFEKIAFHGCGVISRSGIEPEKRLSGDKGSKRAEEYLLELKIKGDDEEESAADTAILASGADSRTLVATVTTNKAEQDC